MAKAGQGLAGVRWGFDEGDRELIGTLLDGSTAVGALLVFALVAGTGLVLGSVRIRSIGLGIAGVLFSGLLFGHFGVSVGPGLGLTMILRVLSAQLLVLYLMR